MEDNGKNVTKKSDKLYARMEKTHCTLMEQYECGEFKLEKDQSMKESLKQMGWDPTDNKLMQLAQWLLLDGVYGESMEKCSTIEEMEDANWDDFGGDNLYVSD